MITKERQCDFCNDQVGLAIADHNGVLILVPHRPHIAMEDGGHLIVAQVRHVESRRDFTDDEHLTVAVLTVVAAEALEHLGAASWFNYQENGNWAAGAGISNHAHNHVYGRSKNSISQPFGEALHLPRELVLPIEAVSDQAVRELTRHCRSILANRGQRL